MIEEARKILNKKNINVEDYNRFVALEKEMKTDYDIFEYSWLAEGFELRLPEIAQKVGNYSFISLRYSSYCSNVNPDWYDSKGELII